MAQQQAPTVGHVEDGYMFMGGDPRSESSWRPVARGATYANGRSRGLTPKEQAELAEAREAARNALSVLPDLERFSQINDNTRSGGLMAVPFVDRVVGAFDPGVAQLNEISARLAPAQRQAGSGTMSDRDLALFLQSVPSVQRPEDANDALIERGRAEGRRRQAYADFIDRYAAENGTLSGADELFRSLVASGAIDLSGYGPGNAVVATPRADAPAIGSPAAPGSSAETAIDYTNTPPEDLLRLLESGGWVRQGNGEPYQVPAGSVRRDSAQQGDEGVAPGVVMRRGDNIVSSEDPLQLREGYAERPEWQQRIASGVASAADDMSFGFIPNMAANLQAVFGKGRVEGGDNSFGARRERLYDELQGWRDDANRDHPVSGLAGSVAGAAVAPGAIGAGRWVAQAPRLGYMMTRGAAVGAGYGAAHGFGTTEGDLGDRAGGAARGGFVGGISGALAPPVARTAGMMTRPLAEPASDLLSRFTRRPMTGEAAAVRTTLRGANPDALRTEASRFRAQGVEPTLADIGGSNVQSRVRAAATRQTPGRETAEAFAAGRRQDVQEFTAGLGERVSPIRATPDELNAGLEQYQREASRAAFDPIRADRIRLDPDSVMALRGEQGRAAIREAARAYGSSVDPDERAVAAELNQLADTLLDQPNTEITVGAADLMSRYLQKAGGTDLNLRRVFGGAGRAVRNNARAQSPGYDAALTGYARRAQLSDAAEAGEAFIGNRGHAQDYVNAVSGMDEAQRGIAAAAGRAGIEKAAETPAGAARVLDAMSTGRGQQMRSEALLGAEGAASLREGAQVGRRMLMTGANVNPRGGSNTYLNNQDGVQGAANLLRGRPIQAAMDFIRSRGMSDAQAEEIVALALDPNRTDEAIEMLATRFAPAEARRLVEQLTPMLAIQSSAATSPRPPVRMVGPNP